MTPQSAPEPAGRRFYDNVALLMLVPPLMWAGNMVLGRAVAGAVPPIGLAFWRWAVATLIVLPWALPHLARDMPELRQKWKIVAILAALGVAAFNTLVYTGLQYTSAVNAILMQSAIPLFIVAMGYVFFRDRLSLAEVAAVIVSMAGVAVLVTKGTPFGIAELPFDRGDILVLGAVVCYAAYTTFLRKRPKVHPASFVFATFLLGVPMLLPFYLAEILGAFGPPRPTPLSWVMIGTVAYVAIGPSVLAYFCYNRLVAVAGPQRAGFAIHLMPVFGTLLAVFVLGEMIQPYHFLGIGLIAAAIAFDTMLRRRRG